MPRLIPNIIFAGRYTLLDKLGIGGYSEVWKAADNMAGEMLVALKIFAPEKGLDQNGIQVFSKEYGLVFNLNHPNLLKPSHYDIWEGSPYLVMPYCKNGSVYGKLGEMSETEVLSFISQAASAINYLHTRPTPIIHQDIKPDNFLIDDEGNFLLSDFGISSKLRRTLTRSVGSASSAGTLAYMPPERFGREQQIITASDIFSLGVTLFELLTERQPFGEHGGLLLKNGADIPDLPHNFSFGMNSLVRSCLNTDPSLRPDARLLKSKASEFLDSLKAGISSQSQPSQPTRERRTVQIPKPAPSPVPKTPIKNIKNKNYWFPTLGILLFAGFILLILIYQNNNSKKEKIARGIADSTAIANSLAVVAAKQQRISDSISDALSKIGSSVPTVLNNNGQDPSIEKNLPTQKDYTYTPQTEVPKTSTGLSIGQIYAGGIIFYIDGTGQHGLVAEESDEEDAPWGCFGTFINATSTLIGTGQINTVNIANNCSTITAAYICNNIERNGYHDWFLPSRDELKELFKHKGKVGGFVNNYYWSSSESSSGLAWVQNFGSSQSTEGLKDVKVYVRAIRAF